MKFMNTVFKLPSVLILLLLQLACAPLVLGTGQPWNNPPEQAIKVGYHEAKDVQKLLGPPIRSTVDGEGNKMYIYYWANGRGAGQKCIVAFNGNGVVSLVEMSR
jgi:hypothetical protein